MGGSNNNQHDLYQKLQSAVQADPALAASLQGILARPPAPQMTAALPHQMQHYSRHMQQPPAHSNNNNNSGLNGMAHAAAPTSMAINTAMSSQQQPVPPAPASAAIPTAPHPNNNSNGSDNNNSTENATRLQHLRTRTRSHVDEAIRGIPLERKGAYLTAMQKCPHLVMAETDPLQFVRRCSYNIWSAAERLVLYWEERLKAFGPDRAFRPLDLTGEGALSNEDILSLHAGFPALLPDTVNGQKVVFCDRRKFIPSANADNRVRACFYIHKVLNEDDSAQVEGVLCFVLLITPRFGEVDRPFVQRALHLATHAFPTRLHWHFLNYLPLPKAGKSAMVDSIMTFVMAVVVKCGMSDVDVHIERKNGEIIEKLKQMGLQDSGIPLCLGGSWKFEEFFRWCQASEADERRQSPACQSLLAGGTTEDAFETTKNDRVASSRPAEKKAPLTAEEKLQKKRLADVIHSRRKRERKRQELINLKEESTARKEENAKLVAEHKRLQKLLAEAKSVIAGLPSSVKAIGAAVPAVARAKDPPASSIGENAVARAAAAADSEESHHPSHDHHHQNLPNKKPRRAVRAPPVESANQACGESSSENHDRQERQQQVPAIQPDPQPPTPGQQEQQVQQLHLQQLLRQQVQLQQQQSLPRPESLLPVPSGPSSAAPASGPGLGEIASTIMGYSREEQAQLVALMIQMNAQNGGN